MLLNAFIARHQSHPTSKILNNRDADVSAPQGVKVCDLKQ